MDIKSMIFFLLVINIICCKSLAIQIYPNDDKLIQSEEFTIKNDPKGMTTTEGSSSVPSEDIEEPVDHKIPYSEHEDPKDVPTKPKYIAPGEWAKPSKDTNISLDFVPTKVYAQVRGTHTIKRAPREEAIKEAETDEEKLNALRLREVVKNSKINTVYTEEGYEDSAYDHAGHIRDADFHEGFARKLKNRLNEKHEEEKNEPDELEDYENDYSDHDENGKENSRENYVESNLNPKLIVRNEIEVLAKDVERSGEEIANSSDIRSFDSMKLQKSTNSDNKLAANNEISNTENDNQDFQQNDGIYISNPTDRVTYETTDHPEQKIVDRSKENLSTNDYGRVVWDFLKVTKNDPLNEQRITFNQKETTTLSPNLQLFTMMPLTLSGPYLSSTIEETVTLPSIYSVSQTFLPRGLDSEIINTGQISSITQNNDQIWPRQTNGINYVEPNDNPTIRPVTLDSTNFWNPFTLKTLDRSSSNDYDEYILKNTSTESATTILPKENQTEHLQLDRIQMNDNDNNTFSNLKNDRKRTKYKISLRHKPRKLTKTSKSVRSRKENDANEYDRNLQDQRAKYLKVLNYVMNQDRFKESDDFTVTRGPNEVKYFDFRMNDRPIAGSQLAIVDQSSVPIESETIIREPNDKNFPRNQPISSVDSFLGSSSLPTYKIDTFPMIDLSPPPLPSTKSRNKYRSISFPYNNNKYYHNKEPIIKYAPVIVDLTRKSRTRRKRSLEYVKGKTNNGTTNREEINQDNNDNTFPIMKDRRNSIVTEGSGNSDYYEEIQRQRNIANSRGNRKTHEELLNESPKVSTSVVDKEIEERFNKDTSNDTDKLNNYKNDKPKVEVEVPSFDYIEELANQEVEKPHPSNTEATINFNKYPFYKNERISDLSGLKYALDPRNVPRKTSTGMEFYDSRDRYKNCEEVDADLDEVHPKEEKPSNDRDPSEHEPRLRGLGEKLDCFKAKYFDENPFDNPLFMEKNVGDPNLPAELDPKKLTERVLVLPIGTSKEYIPQKLSRKPERDSYYPYATRNLKGNRRAPKKERISTSLEILPVPYQKQVYDDVMNNIKESTDIYRNHRMTTISPTSLTNNESNVSSTDKKNIKTYDNVSANKTNLIDIETESSTTTIDGLLPPRGPYNFGRINNPRRNRIIRKSRPRPPLRHIPRTIKRYHKITIQKRSLEKLIDDSKLEDLLAEESRDIINTKPDTSLITIRSRRKKSSVVSKNVTSLKEDPDKDSSSRIVYTIRDRFKHSKPKDELRDVGKFTAESRILLDEDNRRKEPRYNSVERKRNNDDSSTISTILSTILSDDSDIDESTTLSTIPNNKRLKYSTLTRDRTRNDPEKHPSEKESITKEKNNYEVQENIDDIGTTPTTLSTSLKYSKVRDYITSDPPEYKEIFSEEATESPIVEETRSKEPISDIEENPKSSEHNSQESDEDSLEKDKENEEEEENEGSKESKESDESKEEDRRFFHYSSRPYSPSENYEDMKYSELGPRINKPAFYHPPFSMQEYERSSLSPFEESSEETSSGENKKRTRYASFPWSSENEGQKQSFGESKYYSTPIWSYEYPWEKRERLARERRRNKKNYGRFVDFRSKDSNEDVSSSNTRVYPWDLYDVPSKKHQRNRHVVSYFDTDESSSDHKPIKYSSKYNSSNFKSSQSIQNNVNHIPFDPKKLNKNKTQRSSSSSKSRRILTGTLIPEDITLSPRQENERRGKIDEKNHLEVTSVSTIEQKDLKNATKKEIQNKQVAFTTLQSLINMETTTKPNVTDRTIDKSRRRRIIQTNSKNDNDVKENLTKRKEQMKKRKFRSTTIASIIKPTTITTTTTTTTTIIPTFTKSIRRRPQMKSQETNNKFSKVKDIVPTPSTTTVEHHSRVSKESFIRTTYPDNENSTINTNKNPETFGVKFSNKNNEKDRNCGNITSENIERISMTTKETPDHVYRKKQIDKDGIKEMFISIVPNKAKNISQLDNSDISKFDKENNNWKISQDHLDSSGIPSTEVSSLGQDGVVRLIEHSSNNIKSIVSWMSENYDF